MSKQIIVVIWVIISCLGLYAWVDSGASVEHSNGKASAKSFRNSISDYLFGGSQLSFQKKKMISGLTPASVSSDSNITFVGNALYSNVTHVSVQGNYAYISNGPTFAIVDISDESNPALQSYIRTSAAKFWVCGDYAYVPAYSDSLLRIVDISDPKVPEEVGHFHTPGRPNEAFLCGNYLYLVDYDYGLFILDVSEPGVPVQLGHYSMPMIRDIFVCGNYAYLAAGVEGVLILDISDPANPSLIGSYYLNGSTTAVHVNGNYAYVTSSYLAGQVTLGEFHVLDVSDPIHPEELGGLTSPGVVTYNLTTDESYVYLASTGRFSIIDISNPHAPVEIGYFETSAADVFVVDSLAYVAALKNGFQILDISDPGSPEFLSSYGIGDQVLAVAAVGNYAYVAYGYQGLKILDVSTPWHPMEVGHYEVKVTQGGYRTAWSHNLFLQGNYVYLLAQDYLHIVDVSDPTNPTKVSEFHPGGWLSDLWVEDHYAYISGGSYNPMIYILDISDPSSPIEVCRFPVESPVGVICVAGNFLYAGSLRDALIIFDVSDRRNPQKVVTYSEKQIVGGINSISIRAGYAYVAVHSNGIIVIDVSNPANPVFLTRLSAPPFPQTIFVTATISVNYAYVIKALQNSCLLEVYDLSVPACPKKTAYYDYGELGFDYFAQVAKLISVVDDYIYIANGLSGLIILKSTTPTAIEEANKTELPEKYGLSQNYPNPFNSTTIINYWVPKAAKVTLKIYNLLGHEIRTLVDALQKSGSDTARWDGRDDGGRELPSGVYLYRLEVSDTNDERSFVETRKMLLIR